MQRSVRAVLLSVLMALAVLNVAMPARAQTGSGPAAQDAPKDKPDSQTLTAQQVTLMRGIAADTWRFYGYDADIDPNTDLPRDNIGFNGAPAQGNYTSPTNIGVYMWSIVAANDMHLVNRNEAV